MSQTNRSVHSVVSAVLTFMMIMLASFPAPLHALPEGVDVPIIAVSASVFEEELREIIQVGASDYLRKPLREEVLLHSQSVKGGQG